MRLAVTKYYVRHWGGLWHAYTYHPVKGEQRPPKNRRSFSASKSLPKLMDALKRRAEKRQRQINQAH